MTKKVRRKKERKKHGDTSRERHDEEKKRDIQRLGKEWYYKTIHFVICN